ATLFAAVEGNPPFGTADNALTALRRAAMDQREPFRNADALTPVLTTLLAREPKDRPDAGLCARLLHGVASDRDLTAPPAEPRPRTGHRTVWLVGGVSAIVVTAVAALLAVAPWSGAQPAGIADPTVIAAPRMVDPCGLTDPEGLSRYGQT